MSISFAMQSGLQKTYEPHQICVASVDYQYFSAKNCLLDKFKLFTARGNDFQNAVEDLGVYQLNILHGNALEEYAKPLQRVHYQPQIIERPDPFQLAPPVFVATNAAPDANQIYADSLLNSFNRYDYALKFANSAFCPNVFRDKNKMLDKRLAEKNVELIALHGAFASSAILKTFEKACVHTDLNVLLITDQIADSFTADNAQKQIEHNTQLFTTWAETQPYTHKWGMVTKSEFLKAFQAS